MTLAKIDNIAKVGVISLVLTAFGCVASTPYKPPTQPDRTAFYQQSCRDIFQQELGRAIEATALAGCVAEFKAGASDAQVRANVRLSEEWQRLHAPKPPEPVITLQRLTASGRIFRTADGKPWRWKGVSAFALFDRIARGEDVRDVLTAYKGYNLVRVWPYVPVKDWGAKAWDVRYDAAEARRYIEQLGALGWYVELTLLTDDDPGRLAWAQRFVPALTAGGCPVNLLLEAGNEPRTHKAIDTAALKGVLEASGCVYTSGDYEQPARVFGRYLAHHSPRDAEWPRKAHDCVDWWSGAGPEVPGPPQHKPCVLDEPVKPGERPAVADDWRAYGGAAALMGAGATFHSETGKWAQPPTATEAAMAAALLEGLDAFPADAPLGAYSRPVERSLRTYAVGPYLVRVRPTSPAPDGPWTRIGSSAVLWRR